MPSGRVTAVLNRLPFILFAALLPAAQIDFNRDIRPILSDRCFTCHGPDSANRLSKLRFDTEAGAKQDLGGRYAIVSGDIEKSTMIQRITSANKALRMPPVSTGAGLTDRDISVLKQWVREGAQWQGHWSFIAPKRPATPSVSDPAWPKNPIDSFVMARLDREELKPNPRAAKSSLIRRVTLDLTGLPPTLAEVDAFVNDSSPAAYEKVVDRLLDSPRYGERMAARWLDAARYADTNGYQTDAERFMWRWRDWVIEAFNKNMRFDQFTIEQLAGDLLPNPTLDQLIATGFNRNHRANGEGGSIAAEFAVEYVVDRVETTSTVFMGLTTGCARCHDHKYDPILQKEFYQIYAFFNNIPEKGKVFKYGNSPPLIPAPTPAQQVELADLIHQKTRTEQAFRAAAEERRNAQLNWEKSIAGTPELHWAPNADLIAHYPLNSAAEGTDRSGKALKTTLKDGEIGFVKSPARQAAAFDGKHYIDAGNIAPYGFYSKFSLAAWVNPTQPDGAILTRAQDIEEQAGYGVYLKEGKIQINMVVRWLDDCLRVESVDRIPLNAWTHVAVSYDGTRIGDGVKLYLNGESRRLHYVVDDLNQNFQSREPFRIGAGNGFRFAGSIGDVRIYNDVLTPQEAGILAETRGLGEIASIPAAQRTPAQRHKLERAFLERYAPEQIRKVWSDLTLARRKVVQFQDSVPTVMIMQDRPTIADTFLLVRGAYDRPGPKVTRGVPSILPPLPEGSPLNRLGFAQWLVNGKHPLTARVTVNRFWQMLFGTGIVSTVEDFGAQGEWPTHPELLDWLATEFVRGGWDVKGILKTIVMSATYQQSSKATPGLVSKDPENRLLARGPRYRLPAEMVRDQSLALSGLLVEKSGGPSVKPYQPAGLWKELSGGSDYQRDSGEKLYRRSLYTFWKRAIPPPGMMTFDSAGREACTVRENRTNTPLQALTLMNDETYLEAARKLAERMIHQGGSAPADRIAHGFKLALARQPAERESIVLLSSFHHHLDRYQTDATAAEKFLSYGESARDANLDTKELAAYTTVASMILNLDEAITKE